MSELAARLDVSTSAIGNWENAPDEKPIIPEAKTLAKLAAAFEVSAIYLLHGEIAEPEGDGQMREVAHWKDRALKAERELGQIKGVMRSAAGLLMETAGSEKSPEDLIVGAIEGAAESRREPEESPLARPHSVKPDKSVHSSSTLPSGVKETVKRVAEKLSREGRKS